MACRVGVVEKHALFCQLVDRRSFIKLAAVTAHIPLPKIVDKKEDNVWWPRFGGRKSTTTGPETTRAAMKAIVCMLFMGVFH